MGDAGAAVVPTSPLSPLSPVSPISSTCSSIPFGFIEGMDCFADDREALNDFAKYFNNSHLSDVTLIVGEETFPAHRIILTKSSEVFERMLSQKWNGDKNEIELVEEAQCNKVFASFLRFLYCNHVSLHAENTLPILMLSDKYNVTSLRKVCLEYAMNHILPLLSLKDLFHIWFQYATKCYHQALTAACIATLAHHFADIISSEEWEKEWLSMDREQLTEFLKSNELVLPNEYKIWEAVYRWMQAPSHPERRGNTAAPLLAHILPLIRFPFMSADELSSVERCPIVEQHAKLFQPQILLAYKFQAHPLVSRVGSKDFTGAQFLLRNYTDVRWDKRLTIFDLPSIDKYTEFTFKLQTRSSTFPVQPWDWELKIHPKGFSCSNEEFRCILSSNVILDQARSVEYLFTVVDDRKVLRSIAGKKNFTKTRYSTDLEMDKRIGIEELLAENSPLLVNGSLHMQLTLRPID